MQIFGIKFRIFAQKVRLVGYPMLLMAEIISATSASVNIGYKGMLTSCSDSISAMGMLSECHSG